MPREVVGNIPEFTADEGGEGDQEVKETSTEEVVEEKEKTPTESSTDNKSAEETSEKEEVGEDTTDSSGEKEEEKKGSISPQTKEELINDIIGLTNTKQKLLDDIVGLRGNRRELKQKEINKVENQIEDELKDISQQDKEIIEKIARSRGFVSKDEVKVMLYKDIEERQLQDFLNKYPEFKPENDPNDKNWKMLQEELGFYKKPSNPYNTMSVLEKARKSIQKIGSERDTKPVEHRLKTASKGSGGSIQRSSSSTPISSEYREELRRGGWSEEEINEMEK